MSSPEIPSIIGMYNYGVNAGLWTSPLEYYAVLSFVMRRRITRDNASKITINEKLRIMSMIDRVMSFQTT